MLDRKSPAVRLSPLRELSRNRTIAAGRYPALDILSWGWDRPALSIPAPVRAGGASLVQKWSLWMRGRTRMVNRDCKLPLIRAEARALPRGGVGPCSNEPFAGSPRRAHATSRA